MWSLFGHGVAQEQFMASKLPQIWNCPNAFRNCPDVFEFADEWIFNNITTSGMNSASN